MQGQIVGSIDLAQVTLYVFWIFFAGLIIYLRREDKREGYPLESDRRGGVAVQGYPATPQPKKFRMSNGETIFKPDGKVAQRTVNAKPIAKWPGAPLEPIGDPMKAAVGPGAYALREDKPELAPDGSRVIQPMRIVPQASVDPHDIDPRGLKVIAGDKRVAGVVSEIWIDTIEPQIRYLEVALESEPGKHVLLPLNFAIISKARKQVECDAIFAKHFADVPGLRSADIITKLEEEKITAYYAAGTLYASPDRLMEMF
jgi:photosynthetic reaction center H subunit